MANGGGAPTTETITVTDPLPAGVTFASGSGGGFSCSASGQTVTCTNAATPIDAGGTASITLNVNVAANAPVSLSNYAYVDCLCTEPYRGNNFSATDTVSVTQFPDLIIAKAPRRQRIRPGSVHSAIHPHCDQRRLRRDDRNDDGH